MNQPNILLKLGEIIRNILHLQPICMIGPPILFSEINKDKKQNKHKYVQNNTSFGLHLFTLNIIIYFKIIVRTIY